MKWYELVPTCFLHKEGNIFVEKTSTLISLWQKYRIPWHNLLAGCDSRKG